MTSKRSVVARNKLLSSYDRFMSSIAFNTYSVLKSLSCGNCPTRSTSCL